MKALTIAGFDPSGGAGVLADARTFAQFGYRAAAVITSITFQNDQNATGAVHQTRETLRAQLQSLVEHDQIACVKVGMLPTREIMHELATIFGSRTLPAPVVDPVMATTSGLRLMEESAVEVFVSHILPVARLVTPNISEAEVLSGRSIATEKDMQEAAAAIRARGAKAVLIKGGHLKSHGQDAIDVLDDEGVVTVFRGEFISGAKMRGTGCSLSSAIAAGLGSGKPLQDSIRVAKQFVFDQLKQSLINDE